MFKLEFRTDNAAFDDLPGHEIARILRDAATWFDHNHSGLFIDRPIRDANGNRIGHVIFDAGE